MAVAQHERRGFDVAGFVVVEADGVDEGVERGGRHGEDVFEREAGRGEFGVEAAHGEGGGGVFGLGGEHEGDEGLESLVLRFAGICVSDGKRGCQMSLGRERGGFGEWVLRPTRGVDCSSASVSHPIVSTGANISLRISFTRS